MGRRPVCVLFCFVDYNRHTHLPSHYIRNAYTWSVESRLIRTALPQLQFMDIVESLVFYINWCFTSKTFELPFCPLFFPVTKTWLFDESFRQTDVDYFLPTPVCHNRSHPIPARGVSAIRPGLRFFLGQTQTSFCFFSFSLFPSASIPSSKGDFPLSMSQGNFLDFPFSSIRKRTISLQRPSDPLTWRWRKESRVIPCVSEFGTAAHPAPSRPARRSCPKINA